MMLTLCRACGMYRVATVGDREHCLHCGDLRAVQPLDPGPDCEEDPDAELSFHPASPRRRHRHSRAEVRALAATRRYKQRDHRRERDIDPWWSKRDQHNGLLLQKGKRP